MSNWHRTDTGTVPLDPGRRQLKGGGKVSVDKLLGGT